MKKRTRNILISLVVHIIIISIIVIYIVSRDNIKESKINAEFPYLTKADSLNNVVESTFYPSDWRGEYMFQMVTLDNGRKYTISAISPGDESLQNILNRGIVTLIKKRNNDTIKVISNGKEFTFIRFDND